MALPLSPPVEPQLARSAKQLPLGEQWAYEPKFDGFRAIAFLDAAQFTIQLRGGQPLPSYFPELSSPAGRRVGHGQILIPAAHGHEDFGCLQQPINPAESRIKMLGEQTAARY